VFVRGEQLCSGQGESKGKVVYLPWQGGSSDTEGIEELTINGEKVEGWMEAMTMSYPVEELEVLKKVKVGDRIMATVYDGDMTLHNIEVMPPDKSGKKSK